MTSLQTRPIIVVGIACALIIAAVAYPARAGRAGYEACKDDVRKFCAAEKPGGGRIAMCLKQHESELSPACREQVAKAEEEIDACRDDIAKICWQEKPGHGRIVKCLKKHVSELSEACRSALLAKAKNFDEGFPASPPLASH